MRHAKKALVGIAALVTVSGAAACNGNGINKAQGQEHAASAQQLGHYDTVQPLPSPQYSQLRQNLIEIEKAQAATTPTTTFFFNLGEQDPFKACPSIGFPIAATTQLTNPSQIVRQGFGNGNYDAGVVGNIDPTGVYTGDSTGTYVICIASNAKAYAEYWEGYVDTVTGSAAWDYTTHRMSDISNPTATFSTTKG